VNVSQLRLRTEKLYNIIIIIIIIIIRGLMQWEVAYEQKLQNWWNVSTARKVH